MSDYLRYKLILAARTRVWAIVLLHILCSPLGSAVYSNKQGNWTPFVVGTGLFIVGVPLALFDFGITALILAPAFSVGMLVSKATESRRQLGIVGPEQADALLYSKEVN